MGRHGTGVHEYKKHSQSKTTTEKMPLTKCMYLFKADVSGLLNSFRQISPRCHIRQG